MRYIDADKLIEALRVDYDREGAMADDMAIKGIADASVKYSHGQFCFLNAIERVKDIPTADVVPKSEVAILTAQNMALEIAKNDLQHRLNTYKGAEKILEDNMGELIMAAINGAKQEAAREICEEIEMYSQGLKYGTEMLGHKLSSTALIDKVLEFIAELKKEHTEGEAQDG